LTLKLKKEQNYDINHFSPRINNVTCKENMTTQTKTKLPALKELYEGLELKKPQNNLNILLNQSPHPSWIKNHPFAKGVKYIPIERIEFLLTRIFIKWKVEIKTIQTVANSIVVSLRLHYQNVEDKEWSWQDGIGAAPIQTKKDSGAMEWDKVLSDAVMKAAPAAESYAFKDAAEKIGKLFGKDLNRKDEIIYDSLSQVFEEQGNENRDRKAGNDEELIRTSTYDDETKEILYAKVANKDLPYLEYERIMKEVRMNQPKRY
jgi:hypothetical protein